MTPAIRNAFVLGAGLGMRLKTLTAHRPKPLIPICGKPLIAFAFDHLIRNGVTRLVVNTHHRHEAYAQAFPGGTYRGVPVHFAHEVDLLETAGGIKNVEPLLTGAPFVVYNGDILSDLPIEKAMRHHLESGNEVTMVLRSKDGPLQVSLDELTGRIADISQRLHGTIPPKYLFTGVYVVSPEFFARIPPQTKISVVPIFLEMIQHGEKLGGIVLDEGHWWDLGTREKYLDVHRHFFECGMGNAECGEWLHPTAKIAATAKISGATAIGAGASVGGRATLIDCIVWEDAEIVADSVLKNCIVTAGQRVRGTHTDIDF